MYERIGSDRFSMALPPHETPTRNAPAPMTNRVSAKPNGSTGEFLGAISPKRLTAASPAQ